jgi:hypothetical protein
MVSELLLNFYLPTTLVWRNSHQLAYKTVLSNEAMHRWLQHVKPLRALVDHYNGTHYMMPSHGQIRGCILEYDSGPNQLQSCPGNDTVQNLTPTQSGDSKGSKKSKASKEKKEKPTSKTGKDDKPPPRKICQKNQIECNDNGSKICVCHKNDNNQFKNKCISEDDAKEFLQGHPNDFCGKCLTEKTQMRHVT